MSVFLPEGRRSAAGRRERSLTFSSLFIRPALHPPSSTPNTLVTLDAHCCPPPSSTSLPCPFLSDSPPHDPQLTRSSRARSSKWKPTLSGCCGRTSVLQGSGISCRDGVRAGRGAQGREARQREHEEEGGSVLYHDRLFRFFARERRRERASWLRIYARELDIPSSTILQNHTLTLQ